MFITQSILPVINKYRAARGCYGIVADNQPSRKIIQVESAVVSVVQAVNTTFFDISETVDSAMGVVW